MKVVIISGTPGCGKTTISNYMSNIIKAKVITLNELVIKKDFVLEFDEKRETYVVDFNNLIPYIVSIIKKNKNKENQAGFLIIEGHFSDIVPDNYIDFGIVLRCHPDELFNRLKERGYNRNKIIENIQAEILGNCVNYLLKKKIKNPLFEVDTTHLKEEFVANVIIGIINNDIKVEDYYIGKIDWLEQIGQNDSLTKKYLYKDF